jgi:hypothetical protein
LPWARTTGRPGLITCTCPNTAGNQQTQIAVRARGEMGGYPKMLFCILRMGCSSRSMPNSMSMITIIIALAVGFRESGPQPISSALSSGSSSTAIAKPNNSLGATSSCRATAFRARLRLAGLRHSGSHHLCLEHSANLRVVAGSASTEATTPAVDCF